MADRSPHVIRRYEELSIGFWPPATCLPLEGWLVGISDGYTRRANCVYPLYPSHAALVPKIQACEGSMRAAGLAPCFKLTAASEPPGLDKALEERGYARGAETLVQTAVLSATSSAPEGGIGIAETCGDDWLDAYAALHSLTPSQRSSTASILGRIRSRTCYAGIGRGADALACGMCALEGETAGLFAIAVSESHRRQGLGRRLTAALMGWAAEQGGREVFLQVMADNEAARALYASLGFTDRYRYWYRTLPK
jgi:N-acetylglutamate synthase